MEEIKLDVQIRKEIRSRKAKSLRQSDFVPGIVYGGRQDPTIIKLDRRGYERIRRQHAGENVIFHLNVFEGENKLKDYAVILKEEQHHPVSDTVLHIDFKRISLKEKIEVKVPVRAKGEPIGVKRDGGALEHVIWELDVICLPTQIPPYIEVDVSSLEIGDSILVEAVQLPEGVTTKHDVHSVVVSVVPPMKEESLEKTDQPTEPEATKEKKKEPVAEKGEAAPAKEKEKK